jgi:hypothetical protein
MNITQNATTINNTSNTFCIPPASGRDSDHRWKVAGAVFFAIIFPKVALAILAAVAAVYLIHRLWMKQQAKIAHDRELAERCVIEDQLVQQGDPRGTYGIGA